MVTFRLILILSQSELSPATRVRFQPLVFSRSAHAPVFPPRLRAKHSQLTERAVTRLAELLPTYKEALGDQGVFANFSGLISRTKKLATLEMQEAVNEWEEQLQKVCGCLASLFAPVSPATSGRARARSIPGGAFPFPHQASTQRRSKGPNNLTMAPEKIHDQGTETATGGFIRELGFGRGSFVRTVILHEKVSLRRVHPEAL